MEVGIANHVWTIEEILELLVINLFVSGYLWNLPAQLFPLSEIELDSVGKLFKW
jgi:hypothetical protein